MCSSDLLVGELDRRGAVVGLIADHGMRDKSNPDGSPKVVWLQDALDRAFGRGMNIEGGSVNFSSEKADTCSRREHGIENVLELVGLPLPDMYSADLSLFVLHAGVKLIEKDEPLITYLSLTDYIQHKYAPGEPEAIRYYRDIDALVGELDRLGAVVGLIADHGMRDKSNPDGSPKVVWLQDALDRAFGKGTTTVICPITDYFAAITARSGASCASIAPTVLRAQR